MIREKIVRREELAPRVAAWRAEGKIVGFTNGVFDILHAGHIEYLETARARCDVLIVSLNTDISARRRKGPGRPINNEADRAYAVAALSCVDWVTFHSEDTMRESLELLRPSLYIKGGDYRPDQLSSRDVVRAHGGDVLIIPFREGYSTSRLIDTILGLHGADARIVEYPRDPSPSPAVFFDRDGTLNVEAHFIKLPSEIRLIPGSGRALGRLRKAGYRLVIATNQAGIGMGYITEKDFLRCMSELMRQISIEGGAIDRTYYSPYSIADQSPCRKPGAAMLEKAAEEMNLDLGRSWMVGDRPSDIECGRRAGARTILVHSGTLGPGDPCTPEPDFRCADVAEAAEIILRVDAPDKASSDGCPAEDTAANEKAAEESSSCSASSQPSTEPPLA